MVDIRCSCQAEPLLAVGGIDDRGDAYVHIRAHKQRKLIAEVVATSGTIHIHCRSCGRWHRIVIRHDSMDRDVRPLPAEIPLQ